MIATVTFLGHSGFSVEMARRVWVFDYYFGPSPQEALQFAAFPLVFASHSHHDHYQPEILANWQQDCPRIKQVLSYEIPKVPGAVHLAPGDVWQGIGVKVTAFGSTDIGVSYLVESEGKVFYHAGDFNLWHWKDESTVQEVWQAKRVFERVLDSLAGISIDMAFFPVDPRMGTDYDQGAEIFANTIRPKVLFPMHFGKDYEAAAAFASRVRVEGVMVLAPDYEGQSFNVEI